MALHIGVVGCSAEGAALCYRTLCVEGAAFMGVAHAHPEVSVHTHSLATYVDCLERARDHEHVHVAQYEKWGPLFLLLYGSASLYLWLSRRDPYLDNPFEKEAYDRFPVSTAKSPAESSNC